MVGIAKIERKIARLKFPPYACNRKVALPLCQIPIRVICEHLMEVKSEMMKVKRQFINDKGYVVYELQGKRLMKRSRYNAIQKYGKEILKNKEIHHINLMRDDDSIDNLLPVGKVEHRKLHALIDNGEIDKYEEMVNEILASLSPLSLWR